MKKTSILILGTVAVIAAAGFLYNRRPAEQDAAGSGPPLVAVKVPELSPDEKAGETAFNTYCASCHGENAAGRDGTAPSFIHPVYNPGHHGDDAFFLAAKNGARAHHWPFGDMPPVKGVTEAGIAGIITYVRTLQRANGIE